MGSPWPEVAGLAPGSTRIFSWVWGPPGYARAVELLPYTDADLWLIEALETDAEMMRELGGPIARAQIPALHRKRRDDPWRLKIVLDPAGPPPGTAGRWGPRPHRTPVPATR